MEQRGRGRARGQSRGQPGQQQPTQRPGPQQQGGRPQQQRQPGGGPQQQRAPQQTQGAWGGRPQAQQQVSQPQGAWGGRPQAQQQVSQPQGAWGVRAQQQASQPQPSQSQPNVWVKPQQQQPQLPQAQMAGRGGRIAEEGGGAYGAREHATVVSSGGDQPQMTRTVPRGGGNGGGNGGVRGRTARAADIRTRPAQILSKSGTSGQKITVASNYFKLLQAGTWKLLQYRVDFGTEIDNTSVKKKLLYTALREVQGLGGYIFDGTVIFTPCRFAQDMQEYFVQDENDQPVQIKIRLIGEVAWGDMHYLQVFNIVVRKCLVELKLQLVGRNYFDPAAGINLEDYNLTLWPGYFTSIKQHERDILMNAELQFKVMRMDTMFDLLLECEGPHLKQEFQNRAIGAVVLTAYNNRTYRVDDVDFQATPESRFKRSDGSEISYIEYYKQRYGVNIRQLKQPMLVSRSKPREIRAGMPEIVYLVPELCRMTGLTDKQRENFKLMQALAEYTRIGPKERMRRLVSFSDRLLRRNPGAIEELNKWDLKIAESLVKIQARVLPPENIICGGNMKYPVGRDADWTKDIRSSAMFVAGEMKKMAIITPRKLYDPTVDFMKLLEKTARGLRWSLGNYKVFDVPDDRTQSYLEKIESIVNSQQPTLILCIVPNKNSDRYTAIKKKCAVDRGVPSQVVLSKHFISRGVMSVATKIAIQLNCKIGGAPWTVNVPLSNLMVIGYDVCRDTANKSKSFSGMVSSLDRQITRYFSYAAEHKHEEELSTNFASYILIACNKYKESEGRYPERILIYRDAVGDGQIPYVYEQEVGLIKQKLKETIYTNNDLKFAFVIVSKRINTRIFCDDNNPPPGTVVDDVITLPERYDFFIVSQCVRQGTVAPTSYNVIEDTMGLPPDKMQILTYKLTHMYFNWSGTVRVPAPCQYAHKLSYFVAQHLHRTAHRSLENTLFYL